MMHDADMLTRFFRLCQFVILCPPCGLAWVIRRCACHNYWVVNSVGIRLSSTFVFWLRESQCDSCFLNAAVVVDALNVESSQFLGGNEGSERRAE